MELAVHPIVEAICSKENPPYVMLFQKEFGVLESEYGIGIPPALRPREADFLIIRPDKKAFNIEVNFFSGTGSKPQEIVDSYLNRQRELKESGIGFIWITDGEGWKGQQNQIRKGFEEFDFLLNLHFVRQGLLKSVLSEIDSATAGLLG
jgi:type II restriction enzyme